jgi:peptidyl-prolyl cis-trans isomerase SurA
MKKMTGRAAFALALSVVLSLIAAQAPAQTDEFQPGDSGLSVTPRLAEQAKPKPEAGQEPEAARQKVDGIAAIVGDEIILESDIDEELYLFDMRSGGKALTEDNVLQYRGDVVREMVDEMLLVAKAKRDSIELEPGAVDEELDRRVAELETRHGSPEALDAALAAEGLTREGLREIYRDDIERRMLAEQVIRREVHSKIDVTWRDVEEYYNSEGADVAQVPEAFHVAGIVSSPKVSEDLKRVAYDKLSEARAALASGMSFEDAAARYSEDASALRGGDLGWFGPGMMVPEFEEAVMALSVGEVSGIVPSRFGFHIIKLEERDGDRVHARHILARVTPGPEDALHAKARADSLRAMIAAGADFSSIAGGYSDDEASRARGGDLGWFAPGDLDPQFETALRALEPGGITEVIKGDGGYYILMLVEYEEPRTAQLDEIRDQLKDYLYNLRAEERFQKLIEELRREIFIDIRTELPETP